MFSFNLYFAESAFGSMADWAMVFIALCTGILLFLTLKSQQEVQKAQQLITRIEQERFRNEVRPELIMQLYPYKELMHWIGDKVIMDVHLEFVIKEHPAINVRFTQEESPTSRVTFNGVLPRNGDMMDKDDRVVGSFEITVEIEEYEIYPWYVAIVAEYEDAIGSKYKQRFLFTSIKQQAKLESRIPVLIKDFRSRNEVSNRIRSYIYGR